MQLGVRSPVRKPTIQSFNGTSDTYSFSLDLSSYSAIWISYLARCTGGGSEGRSFAIGAGTQDFGTLNRTPGAVAIKGSTGGARRLWTFTRPSLSTWHHWLWKLDLATSAATLTVDGSSVTLSQAEAGSPSGNFGNRTWYWMSDGAGGSFSGGELANIGIWDGAETIGSTEITNLGNGFPPTVAHPGGILKQVVF